MCDVSACMSSGRAPRGAGVVASQHRPPGEHTMPFAVKDLRSFLKDLQERYPQDLVSVRREIDPCREASLLAWTLGQTGQFPVVMCPKIKGSHFPLVSNVHADRPPSCTGASPKTPRRRHAHQARSTPARQRPPKTQRPRRLLGRPLGSSSITRRSQQPGPGPHSDTKVG